AVTDADVGAEGLGQLPAGPRPVLAEQLGELAGHLCSAGTVRVGSGGVRVERLRTTTVEALEGGADGVRVTAQVAGDLGRGPPGIGQEDHLQAVTGGGLQVGPAESLEFRTLHVGEVDAEHETF